MNGNALDRRRKRIKLKNSITIIDNVDDRLVQKHLNSECNIEKVDDIYKGIEKHYDMHVSEREAQEFLDKFKKELNDKRFYQLINDCKKEVITNIVGPFGLGKVVAVYDKVGGNVDTIHNAREGIYATEEAQNAYENRGDYNSNEYHSHEKYKETNRKYSEARKQGEATDYMTGEKLDPNKSHDLDHVVSAKEVHDDAGRVLAGVDGADLANTDTNLKPTSATNNRTKKADSMQDFIDKKNERLSKIDELKSKHNISPQEKKELKKLEELNKIDDEKALEADKKARDSMNETINKEYYTSKEFAKNTAKTGLNEGAKMGMQQALGVVLVEFFTALFDEIIDIYKNGFDNGFDNEKFFTILGKRVKRIEIRLKDKWKDVALAFKDGAISGFISNLVTTMINMVATTGKRVVRIIREGIFSLFKAIKIVLFPPEGLSFSDAMHEAQKLLATGIIISLGVMAEEYVDKLIKTTVVLEPFADTITAILIGSLTGLTVSLVVYYIDKKKNDKELFNKLVCDTEEKLNKFDELMKSLSFDNKNNTANNLLK